MATSLGDVVVHFAVDTSGLSGGITKAIEIIGGFGMESVKMAADFETSMNQLVTSAGEAPTALKMVSNSILQMSIDTATSTRKLADGMYMVESAGHHGAEGLQILGVAARGAKSENADLGTVTYVLTGILHDYHLSTKQAAATMNALNTTVGSGMMHLQDLSTALGTVLPLASALHVPLEQILGATASMTNTTTSAALATQHLAFVLSALSAPNKVAVKEMKAVGLTADEVKNSLSTQGLAGTLQMIEQHVGKTFPGNTSETVTALKKIMGGVVGWKTELALTGGNMKGFQSNITSIAAAFHHGGDAVLGWDVVQTSFNYKLGQAQQAVEVLMIKLGTALLPILGDLLTSLTPLITAFANWATSSGVLPVAITFVVQSIQNTVSAIQTLVAWGSSIVAFFQQNEWAVGLLAVALGALGGIMALFAASAVANMILSMLDFGLSILSGAAEAVTGAAIMTTTFSTMSGIIIGSMGAAAISIWATLGPFLIVGAVIAAVVVGIVLVVKHWGEIAPWLQGVWNATLAWLTGAFHGVEGAVQAVINWFNQWKTPIEVVSGILLTFFGPALIKAGAEAAIAGAKIATNFIASMIQTGVAATVSAAKTTASFVVSMVQSGIQATISAGKITATFIASMVQTGAMAVVNAAKVTGSFIVSLIKTGLEGWASAGKLALFIGQMIATGAAAAAAGVQMAAKFVASLVMAGVQAVITGAKFVASLIPAIVSFAASSIAAAATAIPAMITGFIAWSIGAWSAAAATIAATWPILLIIAAIALLVVGIVLLVQHWGEVTSFLQSIWQAFTDWLVSALHTLASFFTSVWDGIISFLRAAWNWIVSAARVAFALLIVVIGGPILWISLLIYAHWGQIKAFLAAAWAWIASTAATLWSNVVNVFRGAWSGIRGAVQFLWQGIVSFFSGLPAQMVQFGVNLIQGFINGIGSMLGAVGNAASNVINTVKSFLGFKSPTEKGEGQHILEWGHNMVSSFAEGAKSAIPELSGTMNVVMHPAATAMQAAPAQGVYQHAIVGSQGTPQIIQFIVEGRVMAQVVGNSMMREIQVKQGVRHAA
jgi:TP901 family phage tail tape measure protein